MKVWYIKMSGLSHEAIMKGLRWLVNRALKADRKGIIAVPAVRILRNIRDNLDIDIIALIQRSGIEVKRFTESDRVMDAQNRPILVIYPSVKFLERIEGCPNVNEVFVIPFTVEEIWPWLQEHNAEKLDD